MLKQSTIFILIIMILITGCTQTILADSQVSDSKQRPLSSPFTATPLSMPTITPQAEVITTMSSEKDTMPPTLTAVPTTQIQATSIPKAIMPPIPDSVMVNDIPAQRFVTLPPETIQHSQQILAHGKTLGRNPHQFSKIGDSIVDTEQFFVPFDHGNYSLGDYQYLESTIQHYSGAYSRFGFALRDGLNSTAVMDPMWADKTECLANEPPLVCEIRLNNPSIILIHFGTNDWTGTFEENMRQIIEYTIDEGIVPVLITKANRVEINNERNDILRKLASEYHIPLWDFDMIATTLPARGLAQDNAHLTISNDFNYTMSEHIFQGYKAFNISGLIFLDMYLREVVTPIS